MGTITRRLVMAAGASSGLALSLPEWVRGVRAQTTPVSMRYSAQSSQGKAMLKLYARAVDIMMNKVPKGDPRHWEFQWYSHWIPGPQRPWPPVAAKKNDTLQSVYAGRPPTDPNLKLAETMWDGCQAHGSNPSDPSYYQEQFFLPWHRYFVYYFEEIIRGVLQDATFTLPYWDYLGGPPASAAIPPEFQDSTSPLYRSDRNRNPDVNAGLPVDVGPGRIALNSDAFKETVYIKSTPGGDVGFCPILDNNPHGAIHSDVGTPTNMGRVPYAGGDPIFWLHHYNIDRLWESWNRLPGRKNPNWPDRSFTFADASGGAVIAPVAGADRVALLNYQYDKYYVPTGIPTVAVAAAPQASAVTSPSEVRAIISAPLSLGSNAVSAVLAAPATPLAAGAPALRLVVPPSPRNLYLILGGIDSMLDPGSVVYNVYLDLPEGAKASERDPHYVGSLNFFNAAVGHDHGEGDSHGHGHATAFNVTDVVKALQASNRLSAQPTVTLVPNGELRGDAKPTVGEVALVEA
jgi:tyrosinase